MTYQARLTRTFIAGLFILFGLCAQAQVLKPRSASPSQQATPLLSFELNPKRASAGLNDESSPTENPKGMYAGMFFGTSQLNYSFDGSPISISSIDRGGTLLDSVVTIPAGRATVTPDSKDQRMNLDAGFWLGYFPGFLTFNLGKEQKLALGAMTQLGLSFNGGFGAWLGIGPELMYTNGPVSVNVGYGIGWTGTRRKLGKLDLSGVDAIVVESNFLGCSAEDFESENISSCRLHNEESELYVIGSSQTQSFYARIGYVFGKDKKSGLGIVIGNRQERTSNVSYELWGPYKKPLDGHKSALNGAEFQSLKNDFGFSGLFIQIELFTRPF